MSAMFPGLAHQSSLLNFLRFLHCGFWLTNLTDPVFRLKSNSPLKKAVAYVTAFFLKKETVLNCTVKNSALKYTLSVHFLIIFLHHYI